MKKDTIYWRCIQFRAFRCPARHRQNRATGLLELVHSEHNHEQIQTRRKRGTLKELMRQRIMSKQKVEYLVTPRGGLQLSIDNFRFARDRVLQNVVTYRCVHYKPLGCMARVKTYEAEKKLQILQNKHNHPAYMDRRRNGALRSLLNARKQTPQRTSIPIDKKIQKKVNEAVPKTTTTRGKRELEQANDPYGYNSRGNLMYQNYSFSKASSNGMANIIYWRCTEYRKQKCRSTLKTMGKQLYIIDAKHNHVPKKYGHIMSATLPIFNVDVSNELTRKLPDVTLFKTNRAKAEKKKADSSAPASSLLLQQQQQPPASIALSDGSGKKSKKIASTVQVVKPNVDTVKMINNVRPNPDHIVKQLSNGHTLMKLVKTRVRGFCVSCIRKIHDPEYKKKLEKIITYCSACPASEWSCVNCFDESHGIAFLAQRKPKHMGIHKFISTVFSDEALNAYNLHGSNTSGRAKIPMKTYSVFYDCFIEAFESSGLNERELQSQLTAAIKHSRNRMRQRTFRARKSLVKNETTPGDKSE
uniref:Uncharacterized protein n=1 Tax=Anopheles arabiensis TaxID=7173 RepID=A0A182HJT9_ANOAR